MRAVKLSVKHARVLLYVADGAGVVASQRAAIEALRAALKPRPVSSARRKTQKRRETRKEETARIREAVFARAGGFCEFNCRQGPTGPQHLATDLHHAFGRIRVRQSERNCLALCRTCHRMLTNNEPNAAFWWKWVEHTFRRLGFQAEAEMARQHFEKSEFKSNAQHEAAKEQTK